MKFSIINTSGAKRDENILVLAESYVKGLQIALRNMERNFNENDVKYGNMPKFEAVSHLNNKNESRNLV